MAYNIRRVVVIGAGTMGGAIAAHVANAGIPVTLLDIVPRDLEAARGNRNAVVEKGWEAVLKAKPAALMHPDNAALVTLGNLEDDFEAVAEADWIIEAIVERLELKQQLMARLDEARRPDGIVTTNTSGIPIAEIQAGRSEGFRGHFFGSHFFNPPRYMKLLEIIPGPDTRAEVIETFRQFAERDLGKGTVLAKDRPNFIANRIGSWAGNHALNWIVEKGYQVEEVDAMTGPFLGNPKTATFRLLDLVGLDIAAGVAENLYHAVPEDPDRERLKRPPVVQTILERGWLGNKAGQGFYKKVGDSYHPLNLATLEYEPPKKPRFELIGRLRKIEPLEARLAALFQADPADRVARLWRETTLPLLAYASKRIPEIADRLVDLDNAMKWGYNQPLGPFEVWDAIGARGGVEAIEQLGWSVAGWVHEMLDQGVEQFYRRDEKGRVTGYYDPQAGDYRSLPRDPRCLSVEALRAEGKELERNESASLLDMGEGVLLLEFHAKMNALDQHIVAMGFTALKYLEGEGWRALVVGNQGEHFCAGANIAMIGMAAAGGQIEMVRQAGNEFHELLMGFRFCPKPVVMAPFGMAIGGGAEVVMQGARVVAAAESYIGLVELGVGLIPGAGGIKELLRRVVSPAMAAGATDPLPYLQKVFEAIGMAKVATSAQEARALGFLSEEDRIVMNKDHLLAEAKEVALSMADAGYRPPAREGRRIYAAGELGLAAMRAAIFGLLEGRYISEHDAKIAGKLAYVLAGGELSQPQWVTEDYINRLETEKFVELVQEPKTLERIMHMLQVGRPLRN